VLVAGAPPKLPTELDAPDPDDPEPEFIVPEPHPGAIAATPPANIARPIRLEYRSLGKFMTLGTPDSRHVREQVPRNRNYQAA